MLIRNANSATTANFCAHKREAKQNSRARAPLISANGGMFNRHVRAHKLCARDETLTISYEATTTLVAAPTAIIRM